MMGTMLENEYRKRGPKVGDWLCIKYLGMRPGRRGNQYKAFDVDLVPADDIEPEADDDAEDTSLDEWPADSDEEDHLPGPKENC
jgi:hypothetical protein